MAPPSEENQCTAVHVSDIHPSNILLSKKQTKVWKWMEDGQQKKREQVFVDVFYGSPGNKLLLNFNDVRTINGVQITSKFNSGFMSVNLKEELSTQIREAVDNEIFRLCFDRRAELLKQGKKISNPSEMKIMFTGLVKDGDERPDGGAYDDQITCTVPTKKHGQQVVVDAIECPIEDLDGKAFQSVALERKSIKDLVIEIDKVVFGKEITVRGRYRYIVADTKAVPRVMTKRKLAMLEMEGSTPLPAPALPKRTATEPVSTHVPETMHAGVGVAATSPGVVVPVQFPVA
jgi:hypothetical protein